MAESYAGKINRKLIKKRRVIAAAAGREKADLVLKNATYVNVFSNELCTADIAVDEASGLPGDHPAEKMISGAYYRLLLRETLLLAAKEGFLSAKSGENIAALSVTSAMVDAFCLDPMGGNAVAEALETEKDRRFASEINTMLLERAARIAAACLCAILRERGFGAGTLTGICADGTMLKLNPVLRPRMEALIAEYTKRHGLGGAEFLFAGDATLLGCAWAALA